MDTTARRNPLLAIPPTVVVHARRHRVKVKHKIIIDYFEKIMNILD
jgi:hypothetical protein